MKCVCGYEQMTDFEEFIGGLYQCPKCGTFKAKVADDVKKPKDVNTEMRGYCVSGKVYKPENGCVLKLFNEEGYKNITESASINLTPERIKTMVRMLSSYLPKEEKYKSEVRTDDETYKETLQFDGIKVTSDTNTKGCYLYLTNANGECGHPYVKMSYDGMLRVIDILKARLPEEQKKVKLDTKLRDNLLVTMGMRAAYMDEMGKINFNNADELAEFIAKTVDGYLNEFGPTNFDEYIEMALLKEYGAKSVMGCPCDGCSAKSIMKDSNGINYYTCTCSFFKTWWNRMTKEGD